MMIRGSVAVFKQARVRYAVLAFVVLLLLAVAPVASRFVAAAGPLAPVNLHRAASNHTWHPSVKAIKAGGHYYVDAARGSDANAGTSDRPFRTIQKAADAAAPGDTVHVQPGGYGERVQVRRGGAAGAPLAFVAEGAATMKGFTVRADYVTIRGFDITGTDNLQDDGVGIYVEASYCTLEANSVHDCTRGGITVYARPGQETARTGCVVRGNRVWGNAMAGIEVHGRNHLVEGNDIWGTVQYHPRWTDPPHWVDADGIRFFGAGHTFRSNSIHDISYADPANVDPHIDCFQTWQSDWHEAGHDIVFERNYCRVLESQSIHESGNAFMLAGARNLVIRNNVLLAFKHINTGGGGNSRLTIVNNTMAGDLGLPLHNNPAGVGLENCPDTTLRNNLFYNLPGPVYHVTGSSGQGLNAGNNLAFRSDGQAPSSSPFPGDLWGVNPQLAGAAAGDFHLQSGSPCVDAGAALGGLVPNDFYGLARPQGGGLDIGAAECDAGGPPAPPPAGGPVVRPVPTPGRGGSRP